MKIFEVKQEEIDQTSSRKKEPRQTVLLQMSPENSFNPDAHFATKSIISGPVTLSRSRVSRKEEKPSRISSDVTCVYELDTE